VRDTGSLKDEGFLQGCHENCRVDAIVFASVVIQKIGILFIFDLLIFTI